MTTATSDNPISIDIFSDYICPWCYLGKVSLKKLIKEKQVVSKWLHFPLHPQTPPEGIAMKDLRRNRNKEDARAYADHLRSMMEEAGLPYVKRDRLDNSRLAQEVGAWAATQPGGEAYHDGMLTAYFAENRTISDPETILEVVDSVGLDTAEAGEVIKSRSWGPAVQEDWERAWNEGVTGVPTFTSRDLFVYGYQPYEVLERFYNHLVKLRAEDAAGN